MVWAWLPNHLRIRDPNLEFTSYENGTSLAYMLSKISRCEFTLFVIKANDLSVFGFVATSAWNSCRCIYFGDAECFVWTLQPPEKYRYMPDHQNRRMQYVCSDSISLGAGYEEGKKKQRKIYINSSHL